MYDGNPMGEIICFGTKDKPCNNSYMWPVNDLNCTCSRCGKTAPKHPMLHEAYVKKRARAVAGEVFTGEPD